MGQITNIQDLEALYGVPAEASIIKVAPHMTPLYRKWVMASRFCILSTVGPEGTDASPRGDEGPVVQELDPNTLLMPDWRGNNRIDSLRNVVRDARVSVMFMVPGSRNVVRVNGTAELRDDAELLERFARKEGTPRSVIVVHIGEIYSQCARAIMRSELWSGEDQSGGLPSVGDLLAEAKAGFDGVDYDAHWPAKAEKTMW